MSKILLFTDNHFCDYSSIIRSSGQMYSTRLENQIESLNWVNQIAIDKNCDQMICLGDFFDKPDLTSQELSALKEIKWNALPKKFIVGNHELGNNDLSFNSTNALSQIGEVISKPTITCGFGYELLLLPYILESDRQSLATYIKQVRDEYYKDMFITQEYKYTIILSHNDISGIRYGQFESKNGFNVNEITNNCNLFINGHLHNQEQISDKILNLGNLTGQNFSEDGFKYSHCVAVLDTMNLSIELINNPFAFNFYKIEAANYIDLQSKVNNLDNKYSIATVKVPENILTEAKQLCLNHFKEHRLIITYNQCSEHNETNSCSLVKSDHIQQFKDYCIETIGYSDTLIEELSLL